jgi:hypothetical protein
VQLNESTKTGVSSLAPHNNPLTISKRSELLEIFYLAKRPHQLNKGASRRYLKKSKEEATSAASSKVIFGFSAAATNSTNETNKAGANKVGKLTRQAGHFE